MSIRRNIAGLLRRLASAIDGRVSLTLSETVRLEPKEPYWGSAGPFGSVTGLYNTSPGLYNALPSADEHASDCAVHNEPAYPAGPCDCR